MKLAFGIFRGLTQENIVASPAILLERGQAVDVFSVADQIRLAKLVSELTEDQRRSIAKGVNARRDRSAETFSIRVTGMTLIAASMAGASHQVISNIESQVGQATFPQKVVDIISDPDSVLAKTTKFERSPFGLLMQKVISR